MGNYFLLKVISQENYFFLSFRLFNKNASQIGFQLSHFHGLVYCTKTITKTRQNFELLTERLLKYACRKDSIKSKIILFSIFYSYAFLRVKTLPENIKVSYVCVCPGITLSGRYKCDNKKMIIILTRVKTPS